MEHRETRHEFPGRPTYGPFAVDEVSRLTNALAHRYTIERELDAGGMEPQMTQMDTDDTHERGSTL